MTMDEPAEPAPPAPKKKRKKRSFKRKLVIALASLPFLVVLSVLFTIALMPSVIPPEKLRTEAVTALTDYLGVDVAIERLDYHPATGVELFGIVVGPPEGYERDVFRARRFALKYDLSGIFGRHVVVNELALEDPHVVIETRDAKRNIDVIIEHLDLQPSEDKPLVGRLSPIDVTLESLLVGPLTFEMVGEGPNAKVEGVWLEGEGAIGDRLDAKLALAVKSGGKDNIAASVPGAQPMEVEVKLDSTMKLELEAGATDGLELSRVALGWKTDADVDATIAVSGAPIALEPIALASNVDFGLDAAKDELRFGAKIDGLDTTMLDADIAVDGLTQTLVQLLGDVPGRALAGLTLGLPAGGAPSLLVDVSRLHLPLTKLAPYTRALAPDVTAEGTIEGRVRAKGAPASFVAGEPAELEVAFVLDGVAGSHAPSGAAAEGIDGTLGFRRRDAEGTAYLADGRVTIAKMRQGAQRVGASEVRLEAGFDHLTYPIPGAFSATVAMDLRDVDASGTSVGRVGLSANVAGDDVFDEARSREPIVVHVAVDTNPVVVAQPAGRLVVRDTKFDLRAKLDRLLVAAREPIPFEIASSVGGVALADGTAVERIRFDATGTVEDPRSGAPFDADADARMKIAHVSSPQADADDVDVRLRVDANRIAAHHPKKFIGDPPAMMPARVGLALDVAVRKVSGEDPQLGAFEAALAMNTRMDVDVLRGDVRLEKFDVAWPGVVAASASGTAKDVYDPRPTVDLRMAIPPVDLAKAIERLPPGLQKSAPDLAASGEVKMAMSVAGRVPKDVDRIDLTRPPMNVSAKFDLEDVAVKSVERGIDLEGLTGHFDATLGGGRADTAMSVTLARVTSGKAPLSDTITGLALDGGAGLRDEVWTAKMNGGATSVVLGSQGAGDMGAAKFELNATHPMNGGVDLKALSFLFERSGLGFSATGRLAKETFGVLRPNLAVVADIDLAAVRPFAPNLGGAKGRVRARFSVVPSSNGIVDLDGALELDGVDYQDKTITVQDASGRLPFAQRLVLPRPRLDESLVVARGILGDDLEARLEELSSRFARARITLDADDILVVPPRTADHQALRPYRTLRGPSLRIASVQTGNTTLEDLLVEASYAAGLFRLDRVEARLWEGDVSGDLALQLTTDLDVKLRMRGTMTNLNLDRPYALAKGIEPVADPDKKEKYRASATFDLAVGVRDRVVNGNMDVFKISRPLVERLFGALDPTGESAAVRAIAMSERVGLRPVGAKVWIAHNLLNAQFDFERLWAHVHYESASPLDLLIDTATIFLRPVLIPTLGGLWVIPTMNGVIKRVSLSNVIDPYLDEMGIDRSLSQIRPYVAATTRGDATRSTLE